MKRALVATDWTAGGGFGYSVAVEGDTIVVGIEAANAVWIFCRDQGGAGAGGR